MTILMIGLNAYPSAVDVYGGEGGAEALEAVRKKEVEAEANRVAAIKATFKNLEF